MENETIKRASVQTTVSFRKEVKARFEEQKAQGRHTDKTFNAFAARAVLMLLGDAGNEKETKKEETSINVC